MYNTGKPHKALGKLTPAEFKKTIDNVDNSLGYLPLSTVNHNIDKEEKSIKKDQRYLGIDILPFANRKSTIDN